MRNESPSCRRMFCLLVDLDVEFNALSYSLVNMRISEIIFMYFMLAFLRNIFLIAIY